MQPSPAAPIDAPATVRLLELLKTITPKDLGGGG